MSKLLLEKKFNDGILKVFKDKPTLDNEYPLIHCHQTHSNKILEFQDGSLESIEGDGIIIDPRQFSGRAIAIKTADCLPVLLIGEKIALIHAGWRGIEAGILSSSSLKELKIKSIFIAPAIEKYEVQEDFKFFFPRSTNFYEEAGKLYFNLKREAMNQLEFSFPKAKIISSNICTFENKLYNSYRRDKTKIRNWNVFIIN